MMGDLPADWSFWNNKMMITRDSSRPPEWIHLEFGFLGFWLQVGLSEQTSLV